ncbi:unnamed protein product [Diatraea saccharalis]|uniref:Elongation of very long chain fatty acids protein n=1 Tax=Diatraea saccharalis TaxID=40085 RepID=A0A9N9WHP0_9NEOP|nr:unnamed protein product [Diatraea saccharalis]
MINNGVHVIMYTYYLMSAEGSIKTKACLRKHKKWLTVMQMIQFTVMLIYSAQVFLPSCPAPLGVTIMYFPNVIFVYYMFYDFFKNNYMKADDELLNENGLTYVKKEK